VLIKKKFSITFLSGANISNIKRHQATKSLISSPSLSDCKGDTLVMNDSAPFCEHWNNLPVFLIYLITDTEPWLRGLLCVFSAKTCANFLLGGPVPRAKYFRHSGAVAEEGIRRGRR
jgi:hypothetical protein